MMTPAAVKILKLAVLASGALGIVGLALIGLGVLMQLDKAYTILMLVAFALPVAMAGFALVRPPFQPWQAGISLAAFALVAWKLEVWSAIGRLGDASNGQRLLVLGATAGVVLSAIAVLRPEGMVPADR